MKVDYRNHVTQGDKSELVHELRRLAEGWQHLGKHRLAEEARQGLDALLDDVPSVRVGVTTYYVTDAT